MNSVENGILKLNHEKKIKSQLVNTRKIIQNEFQKVKRDRIKRENDLNEKYKPLTQAIDNLNGKNERHDSHSPTDELEWDYANYDSPMDYVSFSEHEDGVIRQKYRHMRDDDAIDVRKKMRFSHPKRSNELSQKIKNRKLYKKIWNEAKKLSKVSNISKSKKNPSNDTDSDDESDTIVHSVDSNKRSRLEKSAIDEKANLMRLKNKKKIMEIRKVDDILMGVKNKAIADSLQSRDKIIQITSDSDIDSHIDDTSKPKQQKKRRSKLYTSSERKYDLFKRIATQKLPETIVSSKQSPQSSIRKIGVGNNSVTIVEDRTMPIEDKEKEKKEKREKKSGSGIEVDFIPYNENVVYEFYDDPNELCERLRLLIASRAAGNSNHSQEINSIISELREAGVIF